MYFRDLGTRRIQIMLLRSLLMVRPLRQVPNTLNRKLLKNVKEQPGVMSFFFLHSQILFMFSFFFDLYTLVVCFHVLLFYYYCLFLSSPVILFDLHNETYRDTKYCCFIDEDAWPQRLSAGVGEVHQGHGAKQ